MPLIIPANSITGGFAVDNSLRFNDGSSDYLNFSPSSTSSRRIFTISFWFKQTNSGTTRALFSTGDYSGGDGYLQINLSSSGRLVVDDYDQGGESYNLRWVTPSTGPLFRDPSAWYHFVLAVDSTQGTQSNRVKVYINGVDISSDFTQTTSTSENDDFHVNTSGKVQQIGRSQNNDNYYDGYLAEFVMIDGQQLDPTSFGEFDEDTGIWKPISVSGLTFGTNGFYLDFENSGSLGADVSGNGNNFTVNNLTSIDQTTDTPTNNFVTLNPLNQNPSNAFVLQNGNLSVASSTAVGAKNHGSSTLGVSSGKWYSEFKIDSGLYSVIGVSFDPSELARNNQDCGYYSSGWGYYQGLGTIRNNDAGSSYGDTLSAGDILGIALDLDNSKLYFAKNGVWQNSGDPTSGATGTGAVSITSGETYFFVTGDADASTVTTTSANFGNPSFTISSGNSDGNGYGNFEYSVPSGYYALNTKNLAEYG
jgi:hypothetical protein